MNNLDKIEALDRNTAALNANTEAMSRLAVVWEKLHAKAVQIEKDATGIQAAGVPIAKFPVSPSRITEPAPNPAVAPAPTNDFVL
jgi:hypothetical protein